MSTENKQEVQVATTIIGEDSGMIMHELVYQYSVCVGSGTGCMDFVLRITDPENPLLLFDYTLSPYDFSTLREQQQLFCEFATFPNSVTSLFNACNEDSEYKAVIDQRTPNGPALLLQQETKISLLTHLKLPLVPASDARLKEYLSSETKHFKAAFQAAQARIEELQRGFEKKAQETQRQYGELEQSMSERQEDFNHQLKATKDKFEKMLDDQKRESNEALQAQVAAAEKRERELSSKYEGQIKEVRGELSKVSSEKSQLAAQTERQTEKISALETQLAELRSRFESIEAERNALLKNKEDLSSQNANLQKDLASLTAKYESVQDALSQKAELAASSNNSVEELRGVLAKKEKEMQDLQAQLSDFSAKASERDWIAEKSKKVIAKLQGDLKKTIQHHNDQKAQWERQKEEMKQVQLENVRLQENVKALELTIQRDQAKIQEVESKNDELKAQIKSMEDADAEQKQLVSYLENQLNKKGAMELLDEEALDDENSFTASNGMPVGVNSPLRRFGTPTKGGSLADYAPQLPETTSLFDGPLQFY